MDSLRDWMRETEKLRESFSGAVAVKTTDQMRDIIMAMADALEFMQHDGCTLAWCTPPKRDDMCYACIAKAARERVEAVIREVTG